MIKSSSERTFDERNVHLTPSCVYSNKRYYPSWDSLGHGQNGTHYEAHDG